MERLHRTVAPEAVNLFRQDIILVLRQEQNKASNVSARYRFLQEVIDMLENMKIASF